MTKKFTKLLPMIGCFSLGLASIIYANTPVETANLPIDSSKSVDFDFRYGGQDRYSFLDIDKLCAPQCQKSVGDFMRSIDNYKSFVNFITPLSQEDLRFYVEWADKIRKSTYSNVRFEGYRHEPKIWDDKYRKDGNRLIPIASQFLKKPIKAFISIDENILAILSHNRLIPEITKAVSNGESLSLDLIEDLYSSLNSVAWFFDKDFHYKFFEYDDAEQAYEAYEEINSGKSDAKVSIMTEKEYSSLFNTEEVDPKTQKSCRTYHDAKRNLTFREIAHFTVADPLGDPEIMVFYTKERH